MTEPAEPAIRWDLQYAARGRTAPGLGGTNAALGPEAEVRAARGVPDADLNIC